MNACAVKMCPALAIEYSDKCAAHAVNFDKQPLLSHKVKCWRCGEEIKPNTWRKAVGFGEYAHAGYACKEKEKP